jgi:hypothetical protein
MKGSAVLPQGFRQQRPVHVCSDRYVHKTAMSDLIPKAFKEIITGDITGLNKLLYESDDFPFWFWIQALWSGSVVHRSYLRRTRKTPERLMKEIMIVAFITFTAREVFALFANRRSPVLAHPSELVLFPIPFILFEFVSLGRGHWTFAILDGLVSFAEGVNRFRFFLFLLKSMSGNVFVKGVFVTASALFDQLTEIAARDIFNGLENSLCNERTVLASFIVFVVYWVAIRLLHLVSQELQVYTEVGTGIGLGLLNATIVLLRHRSQELKGIRRNKGSSQHGKAGERQEEDW